METLARARERLAANWQKGYYRLFSQVIVQSGIGLLLSGDSSELGAVVGLCKYTEKCTGSKSLNKTRAGTTAFLTRASLAVVPALAGVSSSKLTPTKC